MLCSWIPSTDGDKGEASSASTLNHHRLRRQPPLLPFGARLRLRAKRRKRLDGKKVASPFFFCVKPENPTMTRRRGRGGRACARDARASQAEGARMSRSLLRMKGQLRFVLPRYGVKLPVKWNRLSVITRDLPQWLQSVADAGPFSVVPQTANISCGKWTNRCLPALLVHLNQS